RALTAAAPGSGHPLGARLQPLAKQRSVGHGTTSCRCEGELQLELPAPVRELPSLIVAVCPSELALRGDRADRSQPRVSSGKFTAAAAAVAAAESEAEAAELEARAGALFGLRKTCASPSSSAPTRSTASNTPRLEGLDAAGVLTRLYEEEVLAAFRAGTGPGQEELEEVTGVREKRMMRSPA
ncbi:unnamed protein product, partial [Effrenium voratum]